MTTPVLAAMRSLRQRSEAHLAAARKLMPPYGSIAVGAGEFDEWIKGESIAFLLGRLNALDRVGDAVAAAKKFADDAVEIHNRKRPRDVNWQRAIGTAHELIEGSASEVRRAMGLTPKPEPPASVEESLR